MRWILPAVGLLVLTVLIVGMRRRRRPLPYRDATLEGELTPHLEVVAGRLNGRGRAKLKPPRALMRRLERHIGFLSRLPAEELLPAAQWLCDNGRYLQEEAASLRLALEHGPRLPADGAKEPRIVLFAREYLGHTNGELRTAKLGEALAAWQRQAPFTAPELNALPSALRLVLLSIVDEMAALCHGEQRACLQAERTAAALLRGQEKRAMRLFARHRQQTAYLERLSGALRKAEGGEHALWLEQYFAQHSLSAEKLTETERLRQTDNSLWVSSAIQSLHILSRAPWERLLEEWSLVHEALAKDAVYLAMDMESRAYYRTVVSRVSQKTKKPELSVCAAALALCRAAPDDTVQAHVGYYLLDEGRGELAANLCPGRRMLGEKHRLTLFRLAAWAAFGGLLWLAWAVRLSPFCWVPFAAVFLHAGEQDVYWLCRRWVKPRMTPRMHVERLGEELQTLVVCPTLLLDGAHALHMVKHLSVLHNANPDPNLHFLLLGDYRDSLTGALSGDEDIVSTAAAAVRALREDTGHDFFYIQRERVYHAADHLYMSRERKRGSLETLLRLIDGRPTEEGFAYASVPPESLKGRYRYVITLDSDTFLPPGAALRMVGAMAHPLQRRREVNGAWRGIGILQPRMEVAAHRVEGWLQLLLGGQGGVDPYNAPASDFYHDLWGRGSFVGKGIIDPGAFLTATEGKIIPGSVLSHDLLEGELAGCKTASDIVLYDGHPDSLKGFLYRAHRWTRGDWQLLPYVLPAFPGERRAPPGAVDTMGRHKIKMGLFRSLIDPLRVVLLLYAAFTNRPWLFGAALLLCELPSLFPVSRLSLFSLLTRLAALPLFACIQADAVGRTLYRLLVSGRNLLQWVTAAQVSKASDKPPMLFFTVSMLSGGVLAGLSLWRGLFWPGLALAAWWVALPFALPFLEQTYGRVQRPTEFMGEVLARLAAGTLLYFETAVTEDDHGLPADNVQIDPNKGVSHRTSPTNIGLYLAALLAAEKLRLLPREEAVRRAESAVCTLEQLPKWNGHLYNWYDTETLEPLRPLFVSSVDSGNYAVSLLTCAQGLRVLMPELPERYRELPARLDGLVSAMDFRPLFDWDAELFWIGVHPEQENETPAHYDLLASEARMLSFVSIMLGQIPVRHWYRLGRNRARTRRGQTLLSYSGTMFEYMTPLLFFPTVRGTLLEQALKAAFREQAAHRLRGVFGVSESGYCAFDPNLYYQYKAFGIPALALDPDTRADVIAPYASVLSLPVDLKRSFLNLLRLQSLGMEGPMGFFEAADFSASLDHQKSGRRDLSRLSIVRSHMTHHQGMILITICNILHEQYIARLFSDLPRAKAHCLLLEEKPIRLRGAVRRPLKRSLRKAAPPPLYAERAARPLTFPVDAHLLHGGGTTVLIDAQGGGYMARNGIMLTRFRESCRLPSGMRVFLRDSQSGSYWSLTDPNLNGSVTFETAQVVFRHERFHVETILRVFVNPLDGTVLHSVTLENNGPSERMMELCSYLEPALCAQKDDAAHPAYQNLFIRTERLDKLGVAAVHRPKEAGAEPVRLWHLLSTDVPINVFHIQTDRSAFVGRGRSVYAPRGLELPVSGMADMVGDMIEPCLSLRAQFILPAKGKARLVFATLCPSRQDTPAGFLERYDRPESALRCFEAACTQGVVTARYLNLEPAEQNSLSRMTGALCYTDQPAQFRYAGQNTLPLRELWSMGLSGDLPILLLECGDADDLALAELLLKAHAWYRMSGLWVDLVLLANQPAGYEHPLQTALGQLVRKSTSHELIGKDGGVRLLERESLTSEQADLLRAAARLALSTANGSLDDQLSTLTFPARGRAAYLCKPSVAWKMALPQGEELLYANGFGGFSPADGSYVITLPPGKQTPAPWCSPLCSGGFGTLAGESGLVFTYAGNSHTGRLTRWPNDSVCPGGDENFFLRDDVQKLLWSVTRNPLGYGLPCRVTYSPGEAVYESSGYGVYARLHCFTDERANLGVRVLRLKNEDTAERVLTYFHTCVFSPSLSADGARLCTLQRTEGGLLLESPQMNGVAGLWGVDPEPALSATMSAGAFQGLWGVTPAALSSAEPLPSDGGNTAALCFPVQLKPGESKTIVSALGYGVSRKRLERAVAALRAEGASPRLRSVKQKWEHLLSGLRFDLPDPALTLMLNRWLPYQALASRLMMRAGFYQAGGAYGFRDQLQDMLPLCYTTPDRVREHLLLCAAHQYEEGDVQHWWHPERWGVRTRISDDLLFLPYVTAVYVQVTGDAGILREERPYLRSEPLREEERQRLEAPEVSPLAEPLWTHCIRAIDRVRLGAHGLPLMGGGDWNDGMDRVGGQRGESVWLGLFLCEVLRRFLPLCEPALAEKYGALRQKLMESADRHAWDGAWYLRGWYDSGDKLGSVSSAECRIDLLPQCWAVLAGVSRERGGLAMDSVWRMLYERDLGVLKLFAPPFDGAEEPGYIAGYLPGVRENGGQYTHALPWAAAAFHQLGQDDRAWELMLRALPVRRAATRQLATRYRVEPYVLAGDVYTNPQQRGRGGWTWYTGSAAWYLYVVLEQLLGFQKEGDVLRFRPVLPKGWESVSLTYQYGAATYRLHGLRDCPYPTVDGEALPGGALRLTDDGRIHEAVFPVR